MLGLVLIILASVIRAMKFDCNHEFFIILFILFIYFFAAFSKRAKKSIWLFLLQMKLSFTLNGIAIIGRPAYMYLYSEKKYFLHCRSGQISSYLV